MRKFFFFSAILFCGTIAAQTPDITQPDTLGLPGDNLDLYRVLDLFKSSASPEAFEKALNDKENHVNNLDLNGDGNVDYLRVVDNADGNTHVLIIRDAISASQTQDVAVIEIEKKDDGTAQLQLVGDEDLYGKDYIIEPGSEKKGTENVTPENKWRGFRDQVIWVDVWMWPCVQYVYYPGYVIWVSPWYWGFWPGWWYPWPPYGWAVYYGWVYPYHEHYYHHVHEHHLHRADTYYGPRRKTSEDVQHRYAAQREAYKTRTEAQTRTAQPNIPHGQQPPVQKTQPPVKTNPGKNQPVPQPRQQPQPKTQPKTPPRQQPQPRVQPTPRQQPQPRVQPTPRVQPPQPKAPQPRKPR